MGDAASWKNTAHRASKWLELAESESEHQLKGKRKWKWMPQKWKWIVQQTATSCGSLIVYTLEMVKVIFYQKEQESKNKLKILESQGWKKRRVKVKLNGTVAGNTRCVVKQKGKNARILEWNILELKGEHTEGWQCWVMFSVLILMLSDLFCSYSHVLGTFCTHHDNTAGKWFPGLEMREQCACEGKLCHCSILHIHLYQTLLKNRHLDFLILLCGQKSSGFKAFSFPKTLFKLIFLS